MKLFFVLLLFAGRLSADALALYLTWYGDPATTMAIQWHTPLEEKDDEIALQSLSDAWKTVKGSHLVLEERLVHKVLLDRLSPDTEYSFRVGSDPVIYKFKTAPDTLKAPLRFCVGGDIYQEKDLFRKMCRAVREKDPLFAVLGGDIAYAINTNPFRFKSTARTQWFSFLQEWKEEMISPEGQVIPFLLVPGNHDLAPHESALYFKLFAFPEKRLYRTVDFGNYMSLILLDSDVFEPIEGRQTEWLVKALQARDQIPFLFPVYHIAAYPSVYSYSDEISQKIRTHWCPLFDKHRLSIAFENHNHAYKRTYPIRGNRIADRGVTYLGDGCWGASPRKPHGGWYLAKREKTNNVFLIELSEGSARIEAINLQGEEIDRLDIPEKLKTRS